MLGPGGLHRPLNVGLGGHVSLHGQGVSAPAPDPVRDLRPVPGIDVHHHHPGPFSGERQRSGLSDAGSAAGDQRNLIP